jgi:4'-phosphopantetheinyl transferase
MKPRSSEYFLNPGYFYTWSIYISQSHEAIPILWDLLTPEEKNRANSYKFPKHRDAFIVSRGYLRQILSKYLQIPPQLIEFAYTAKGKPYLVNYPQLQFNLSHSQDLIVYAITYNRPIGIDVEYLRTFPDAVTIAQRFFSAQEAQFISNCHENTQSLAFFQGWTSKEAILKATGAGIAGGLASIIVELNPSLPPQLLSIDTTQEWFLTKITTAPEYLVMVATNAKIDYQLFTILDLGKNFDEIS